MLLFNSWNFHAIVFPVEIIKKGTAKEITSNSSNITNLSQCGVELHKGEVLTEIDDNEEYDTENDSASIKEKNSSTIVYLISNNL